MTTDLDIERGRMNRCVIGDCRDTLREWAAQGVKAQMCVTSPPYWGLRDYGTAQWEGGDDDCDHRGPPVRTQSGFNARYFGKEFAADKQGDEREPMGQICKCGAKRIDRQLGLEPTPAEYVANMVEVFRLVREVLADDGTLWLNLGDSYANDGKWGGTTSGKHVEALHGMDVGRGKRETGLKPKDIVGIPWRVAFALQADGWWLRQDIIWSKPNPMPESVTDRCTKSHEYIFLLSKSERYFYDAAAIAEPITDSTQERLTQPTLAAQRGSDRVPGKTNGPMEAVGTPRNDGERWNENNGRGFITNGTRNRRSVWTIATEPYAEAHFATFPTALIEPCIMAGSRPGDVVLDPFFGSGTTGEVCERLGRQWLGCELNPQYAELQRKRTAQRGMVFA